MSQTISNRVVGDRASIDENSIQGVGVVEYRLDEGEQPRSRSRRRQLFAPDSFVPTYTGIGLVVIGFALIGLAWGRVAGLTDVARQTPYLISAGFTGLALVMCGLVAVNIAAKRQDAAERARQFAQLSDVLRELRRAIDDDDEDSRP